jgi:hypothetical protein
LQLPGPAQPLCRPERRFPGCLDRTEGRGLASSGRTHDRVESVAAEQNVGCSRALISVQFKLSAVFVVESESMVTVAAYGRTAVVVPCFHDDILIRESSHIRVEAGAVEVEDALIVEAEIGLRLDRRRVAALVERDGLAFRCSGHGVDHDAAVLRLSGSGFRRRPVRLPRGGSTGSRWSVSWPRAPVPVTRRRRSRTGEVKDRNGVL